MHVLFAHVGLFVVDASMIIGSFQKPVPAKIVSVDPASGLNVSKGRSDQRFLTRVRLQFQHPTFPAPFYPQHRRRPVSGPTSSPPLREAPFSGLPGIAVLRPCLRRLTCLRRLIGLAGVAAGLLTGLLIRILGPRGILGKERPALLAKSQMQAQRLRPPPSGPRAISRAAGR